MGIDRAFRAFAVPKNNQVYEREDHYEDFLVVDRLGSNVMEEDVLYGSRFIKNLVKNITSNDLDENKISFAFVRTDGFSSIYKDEPNSYKAIMTPVSSYGGEQAVLFTFGFKSNTLAGNALYKKGSNFFNNPIRYTDLVGKFNELWFGLGDNYIETTPFPNIANVLETKFNKGYSYPLVQSDTSDLKQDFLIKAGSLFEEKL